MSIVKHTLETFASERNLTPQSALNLLSKLKKQGFVQVSGGGRQKKIYTISNRKRKPTSGMYDFLNKHSPEKIIPAYEHYTYGKYTIENAIIDGLLTNNIRVINAVQYLFWHIKNWQKLFLLAKKNNVSDKLRKSFENAKANHIRTKKIPKKYQKNKKND